MILLVAMPVTPPLAGASDAPLLAIEGVGNGWVAFRFESPYAMSLHVVPTGPSHRFLMSMWVEGEDGTFGARAGIDSRENWDLQVRGGVDGGSVVDHRSETSQGRGWAGFDGFDYGAACGAQCPMVTFRAVLVVGTDDDTPWRFTFDTMHMPGTLLGVTQGTNAVNGNAQDFASQHHAYVGTGGNALHTELALSHTIHVEHGLLANLWTSAFSTSVSSVDTPAGTIACPCRLGTLDELAPPGDYTFHVTNVGYGPADLGLVAADIEFPS